METAEVVELRRELLIDPFKRVRIHPILVVKDLANASGSHYGQALKAGAKVYVETRSLRYYAARRRIPYRHLFRVNTNAELVARSRLATLNASWAAGFPAILVAARHAVPPNGNNVPIPYEHCSHGSSDTV